MPVGLLCFVLTLAPIEIIKYHASRTPFFFLSKNMTGYTTRTVSQLSYQYHARRNPLFFFFIEKHDRLNLNQNRPSQCHFSMVLLFFFSTVFLKIAIIVYLKSLRVKCCNCRKGHIKVLFPSRITFFSLVFITAVCLLFPFMKSQTARISTIQRGITVKCSDHVCI